MKKKVIIIISLSSFLSLFSMQIMCCWTLSKARLNSYDFIPNQTLTETNSIIAAGYKAFSDGDEDAQNLLSKGQQYDQFKDHPCFYLLFMAIVKKDQKTENKIFDKLLQSKKTD